LHITDYTFLFKSFVGGEFLVIKAERLWIYIKIECIHIGYTY
jgi:hypothetical protein